ncbi:MAG: leucyl/phenylalanyl-tRNA--protein transferase [Thermomicrobiales bacterium]
MPEVPPPSGFSFPAAATADAKGRVVVGGDLEPSTLLAAYRAGLFPMRQGNGELAWWSPDPRAIITPDRLCVSKSLRRSRQRFLTRVDTAFEAVVDGCAERDEDAYHWITTEVREAFVRLHHLGWAHSVEAWTVATDDEPSMLVGGLYGVAIGGLFSGESMFHRRRDASKVALVALVDLLRGDDRDGAGRLIDVQWITPHMASLGAAEVPREEYLARLERALTLPLPAAFTALPSGSAPAP